MPRFHGDQSTRLIRKYWGDDAESLAQELFAMWVEKQKFDGPVTFTRTGDDPAITIIDRSDGTSSPIQIVRDPKSQAPAVDPGGYECCPAGGGGGGGGGGEPEKEEGETPAGPSPGGGVGNDPRDAPPGKPDPNMPRRRFSATVSIRVRQGAPDIFGFNGQEPSFTASGCCAYKPDAGVDGPTTGFDPNLNEPKTIASQIMQFMTRWELDGYSVIGETVIGPGASCV